MGKKKRSPRVTCNMGGLLQQGESNFKCRLENISLNGALVSLRDSSSAMIQPGDTLCLKIRQEVEGSTIAIRTRVAHIGFSLLGLAFLELDPGTRNSLELIIAEATPATASMGAGQVHHN